MNGGVVVEVGMAVGVGLAVGVSNATAVDVGVSVGVSGTRLAMESTIFAIPCGVGVGGSD
jgi:hypothetical protein